MRQIIVVAVVALTAAILACAGTIAFVKLTDEPRDAGRAAQTQTSAPPQRTPGQERAPTEPRPTVTVTKPVPKTVVPEQPGRSEADAAFLALIAADGITAPDDWALRAGRATCGQDYESAREYLTSGGLYDHHVQTFLDDWLLTHGGC